MNILVFTSAMVDEDFAIYQTDAKIKPNPSNQNFYSKLIKCLSLKNNVTVVSHRPFSKGMFRKSFLNESRNSQFGVNYYYTYEEASKLFKFVHEQNEIVKTAKVAIDEMHTNDFVILTDTLRVGLLKAARKIAQIYGVKIFGMLTDNPENLSSKTPTYVRRIKSLVSSLDGYLSLSSGLVQVFNNDKPNYVFEGLVTEENYFKKEPIYDYYFFCGSLYERYGVKNLVDAFHKTSIKSKLVIAGSGPLAKYIEQLSLDDYRILYLTQLPKDKIFSYERNSIANINPRPINQKLDRESVPSKLIEYLSIETPIISTKFEKLYGTFKDDINWINGNDAFSIQRALEDFDACDKEEAKRKALVAKQKAFEFYGLGVQVESITHFLVEHNSSNND